MERDIAIMLIKNAKDDPTGAIEKGGTEAAKLGAKAIGNAVAPGVGEAAAKAIDDYNKRQAMWDDDKDGRIYLWR